MHARTFRITARTRHVPLVEALLRAQGFEFSAEPYYGPARRLEHEPFPLGSSLAAAFGLIYIQDRSSMLPPVLLDLAPGDRCLDMCASPGGKTGILALRAGEEGFVLAAEASKDRLATLRQNLRRACAANAASIGVESQHLCLAPASLDAILLDPPCSGWGTVDKNPKVMELWTPEKAQGLARLQRTLLARAAALLKPGGRLMYSTCTTNVCENEEQAAWALAELPLVLAPLSAPGGFEPVPPALPGLSGVLRVGRQDGEDEGGLGQGFFLAAFRKREDAPAPAQEGLEPAPLGGRALGPKELARAQDEGADFSQLPPGEAREFAGKVYFLHQGALSLSGRAGLGGAGQRWQGLLLGQMQGQGQGQAHGQAHGQGGRFVPTARARLLLPPPERLSPSARLDVDEPAPILDLLAGRSLEAGSAQGGLAGLYFRGLPLGWLARKGRRLLWSDR